MTKFQLQTALQSQSVKRHTVYETNKLIEPHTTHLKDGRDLICKMIDTLKSLSFDLDTGRRRLEGVIQLIRYF